jgi:hypothetical protein
MVLADASVWVRFLANRAPFAAELDRLLHLDEVAGHEFVYGDLLTGSRVRRKLLAAYQRTHQPSLIPHRDVVRFVRERDPHGRGIGWVDVHLLASAIVERMQLWTADARLAAVARELGVGYEA